MWMKNYLRSVPWSVTIQLLEIKRNLKFFNWIILIENNSKRWLQTTLLLLSNFVATKKVRFVWTQVIISLILFLSLISIKKNKFHKNIPYFSILIWVYDFKFLQLQFCILSQMRISRYYAFATFAYEMLLSEENRKQNEIR